MRDALPQKGYEHPTNTVFRFAAVNLRPHPDLPDYGKIITDLTDGDGARLAFVKACLTKLGLEVNDGKAEVPALTSLHLSSISNTEVTELLYSFGSVIEKEDGQEYIKDEADTFHIKMDAASPDITALALSDSTSEDLAIDANGTVDYNKILKVIIPHETSLPTTTDTPRFNHKLYFSSLKKYQLLEDGAAEWQWGNVFMYGDVVTSTNTLLEKYATPESIKLALHLADC